MSTELLPPCQGTLKRLPQVLLRCCRSFVSLERSALISFGETHLAVRGALAVEMMSDGDELYFNAEAKEHFG